MRQRCGWRFQVLLALCILLPISATAQQQAYSEAAARFNGLPVTTRFEIQSLLIAVGLSDSVANEDFNQRIFDAISVFQSQNGFPASGAIDQTQLNRLRAIADPVLAKWSLRRIPHPLIGTPLWVPAGLTQAKSKWGYRFEGADGSSLDFSFFPGIGLEDAQRTLSQLHKDRNIAIAYSVVRQDFFVIGAVGNSVEAYLRFHSVPGGVVGFWLLWDPARMPEGKRLATMMSDLFRSSVSLKQDRSPPIPRTASFTTPSTQADARAVLTGTGFFVSGEGHVLTNAHVVSECQSVTVDLPGGPAQVARVVARDAANDLALLAAAQRSLIVPTLRTGIRTGESIAVYGFPLVEVLPSSGNFTLGNVTATAGLGDDTRMLQLSAPVQSGNSGGPLLDQYGNVVGIVTSKLRAFRGDVPQNVNFAVKSAIAINFLEANGVNLGVAAASNTPLSPPDLADRAKAFTVFIACRRI